jgi:hypothetical protein
MKLLLIFMLGGMPYLLIAQGFDGSRTIVSLTSSNYQKQPNAFASANLIAASAFSDKQQIGIYAENRFMMHRLSNVHVALTIPVNKGAWAFSGNYLGTNGLFIYGISAGNGIKLTDKLGIGVKMDLGIFSFDKTENLKMIGYQTGMRYQLSEKTIVGFHFSNKRYLKLKNGGSLPGLYAINAGIGHQINQSINISCEMLKESDKPIAIAPSLRWEANSVVYIQAGIVPPINDGYIGLGWNVKKQDFFIGISSHSYLGFSGSLSYVYEIK